MWASPSKIPTKRSLNSSEIVIRDLWADDKRTIPFVERVALRIVLTDKNKVVSESCWLYKYIYIFIYIYLNSITTTAGLSLHKKTFYVSHIVSEDPTKTCGPLVSCWFS